MLNQTERISVASRIYRVEYRFLKRDGYIVLLAVGYSRKSIRLPITALHFDTCRVIMNQSALEEFRMHLRYNVQGGIEVPCLESRTLGT